MQSPDQVPTQRLCLDNVALSHFLSVAKVVQSSGFRTVSVFPFLCNIAAQAFSNMDPTEDQGPRIIISVSVLAGLSTLFLGLRIYCKLARHRSLWWDDHILIVSWVGRLWMDFSCLVPTDMPANTGLTNHLGRPEHCQCPARSWETHLRRPRGESARHWAHKHRHWDFLDSRRLS